MSTDSKAAMATHLIGQYQQQVASLVELDTITRLQEEVDTWKKHAAESDAELVAIWDALGLRKDPAGVTALDKIRDLIAKIGEQGDRLEAMKRPPVVDLWVRNELTIYRYWCARDNADPNPQTIAIRDWLEAFLGESKESDPWKDRRGR